MNIERQRFVISITSGRSGRDLGQKCRRSGFSTCSAVARWRGGAGVSEGRTF